MGPKYLITGVTGGLGRSILTNLLKLVPASEIAVSSSKPSSAAEFESLGVQFRLIDFGDKSKLGKAFEGVEKLFFVSTDTFDNQKRIGEHRNVVEMAKAAGVGHVYYSSVALGGFGDSNVELQQAHLATERMLKEAGITYTSVRMGIYAEAFPFFLNWYPTDPNQTLYLPSNGSIAYASRDELGEATAKLMVTGGHENEIVLLTGPRTHNLVDIIHAINETTERNVAVEFVDDEYVRPDFPNDEGGKSEAFFRVWTSLFAGFARGEAATVSPLMSELLGREAKDGVQMVKELLGKDKDYTWHQNYAKTE